MVGCTTCPAYQDMGWEDPAGKLLQTPPAHSWGVLSSCQRTLELMPSLFFIFFSSIPQCKGVLHDKMLDTRTGSAGPSLHKSKGANLCPPAAPQFGGYLGSRRPVVPLSSRRRPAVVPLFGVYLGSCRPCRPTHYLESKGIWDPVVLWSHISSPL